MQIVQNPATNSIDREAELRRQGEGTAAGKQPRPQPTPGTSMFPEEEYVVAIYRNGRITQRRMTAEQVQALDPTEADFHWDTVFGRISIQPPQGERIEHFGSIPAIGSRVGAPLLQRLMFSPGELLPVAIIRRVPGLENMAGNPLAQRLTKIRRAFRDSEALGWFLVTARNPFRVSWNKRRSYLFVEPLARPTGQYAIAG